MYARLVHAFAQQGHSIEIIDETGRRHAETDTARFTLRINSSRFYRFLLWPDFLGFGEAYMRGDFDINDPADFLEALHEVMLNAAPLGRLARLRLHMDLARFALGRMMRPAVQRANR